MLILYASILVLFYTLVLNLKILNVFFSKLFILFKSQLKGQYYEISLDPGADLGFSRGGADFQKKFENFDDLFFF